MVIRTECPHCSKPYHAAGGIVGRRVRCRGCGGIFTLNNGVETVDTAAQKLNAPAHSGDTISGHVATEAPALPAGINAARPTGDLDPMVASAFRIRGASSPSISSLPAHRQNPATPRSPLDAPDLNDVIEESDAVFTQAFQTFKPPIRPNYIHNFPYAYLIDRWLPPILTGIAVVWLILQIAFRNNSGVGWAIPLRLLLAALGYVFIVYPLGWLGMSLGCRWAKFARPPSPGRRVLAATLFPYVLLLVIWHLAGNMDNAVPGVAVALFVAIGLSWLMYRPMPEEALISLMAAGGTFLFAVLGCAAATIGINEGARAIARSSKPDPQRTSSPVGPGLAWDAQRLAPQTATLTFAPPPAVLPDPVSTPASTNAFPTSRTLQATVQQAAPPATAATVLPQRPLPGGDDDDRVEESRLFSPGTSTRPVTRPTQTVVTPAPVVASTGDPLADRIVLAASPLIAKVSAPKQMPRFERAVFPLMLSSHVLFIQPAKKDNADTLEIWDIATPNLVASRDVSRDETGDVLNGNYALNASGTLIARIGRSPSPGVDLVRLDAGPALARVPLPLSVEQHRVIGFGADDRLLIRLEGDGKSFVQIVDLHKSVVGKPLEMPANDWIAHNRAMSADGRLYAVVGTTTGPNDALQAQLAILDIAAGAVRRVPIQGVDSRWSSDPTGVAFSSDGKQVAILYEQDRQATLLSTSVDAGAFRAVNLTTENTAAPAEDLPPATGRLASIEGGRWLIGGNAVLDAESGTLAGELGVPQVLGQHAFPGTVALIRDDDGGRRIVLVHLATRRGTEAPVSRPATLQSNRVRPVRP